MIRERAGIHEDFAIADAERERQRVGVPVRGEAEISERSRVHENPHFIGRVEGGAEQVIPGFGELPPRPEARATALLELRQPARRLDAEQRDRLAVGRSRLRREIRPIEQHGAGRDQRRVRREARLGRELHDVAVVGVADHWQPPGHVRHRREEVDHHLDAPPVDRREIFAVRARREPGDHQEIEHERLIRESLLAIAAVGRVLPVALLSRMPRQRSPQLRISGHSGQVDAAM